MPPREQILRRLEEIRLEEKQLRALLERLEKDEPAPPNVTVTRIGDPMVNPPKR